MARLNKGSKSVAKQVDPFFAFMGRIGTFIRVHWIPLIVAVGVVVLLAGVAYTVDYLHAKRESSAWITYFNIIVSKQKGGNESRSLEEVVASHPNTIASKLAAMEVAARLYQEGRYSEAMEFIKDIEKEDEQPFFKYTYMLLKAKILDKLGKTKDALGIYEDIMVSEDALFLGMEPYVQSAILYFKTGNTQAALRIINQGMMKFQKGYETMAVLLNSFYRLFALNLVSPSELF